MNRAPAASRSRASLLVRLAAVVLAAGAPAPAGAQSGCTSSTTPLAVGQTVSGELSTTDCLSPSRPTSYYDHFTFTAAAGTQYVIEMRSLTLDSFLYLRDAAGMVIALNDDSNGSLDARIVYTAATGGDLVIEATSFYGGRTGAYDVSLVATDCQIQPIASGQTVQGTIAPSDCFGGFGYDGRFDAYTFDATPGMRYTAVLTAEFFGYVALKSPTGEYVALGEHGSDPAVQTLLYEPDAPGTYTLEVSGAGQSVGAYTLTFSESTCTSSNIPIALDEALPGELSFSDCFSTLAPYGAEVFQDSYTFTAVAGEIYTVTLASTAFAPLVTVLSPSGQIVAQRGGSQAVPARVNVTAAASGTYRIEASSLYYRQIGAYTVSLAAGTPCSSSTTAIAEGQVLAGALDGADCYGPFRPNAFHDRFTFDATAGARYTIDMTSSPVDAYLYLVGPEGTVVAQDDDSGASYDARIVYTAPADGAYTIYATSFWADDVGPYTVSLNAGATCAATPTPIEAGAPAAGTLETTDCRHSIRTTSFHDAFTFTGAAGEAVSITMESAAFDTFLYLRDASGAVVDADDDGGGGLNSWITATLPADGVYTVEATSYGTNATGAYTVTLGDLPGSDCTDTAAPIAVGETLEGALSGDECGSVLFPSAFRDPYALAAVAGGTYTISLGSDDFDTVLVLIDPDGVVVGYDDDGGTGLDSRLVFTAQASGAYTIEATTFAAGATGAYVLSLAEGGGGGGDGCTPAQTPILAGQSLAGDLAETDCFSETRPDAFRDEYTASVDAGVTYVVEMSSDAIDPWLIVRDASGAVVGQDDDSGEGLDARVTFTASATGSVLIEATSFGQEEIGPYTISLSIVEGRAARRGGCAAAPLKVVPGTKFGNSLQKSDCPSSQQPGSYEDRYALDAVRGALYEIAMTSNGLDAMLLVLDESGAVVAEDDNGGGKGDARIAFVAPADGTYTIQATSARAGETGAYELSVGGRVASTVGVYVPAGGHFFLRDSNTPGVADAQFGYGPAGAGWVALSGDWDGDGDDTPGLYDPASGWFFLRNANAPGPADAQYQFGPGGSGWFALVGDWNGDGVDTPGLYDPASGWFFLTNANAAGPAELVFQFGPGGQGWAPLAGDWDGDGTDTVGAYAPAGWFFLRNANAPGTADLTFGYGPADSGWTPLAGDWNADGVDTVGLYASSAGVFFLRNQHAPGAADLVFQYGAPGLQPIVGAWTGR